MAIVVLFLTSPTVNGEPRKEYKLHHHHPLKEQRGNAAHNGGGVAASKAEKSRMKRSLNNEGDVTNANLDKNGDMDDTSLDMGPEELASDWYFSEPDDLQGEATFWPFNSYRRRKIYRRRHPVTMIKRRRWWPSGYAG